MCGAGDQNRRFELPGQLEHGCCLPPRSNERNDRVSPGPERLAEVQAYVHSASFERRAGCERIASSTPPPTARALSETNLYNLGSVRGSISPILIPVFTCS